MENPHTLYTPLTSTSPQRLFDLSMLEEMDDSALLLELLSILLRDVPKDIAEMQVALKSGETDEVCKKAHKLRGSTGIIQALPLIAILEQIEAIGSTNGNELASLVENAAQEYSCIDKEVKLYMQQL
jgi:HPt (histidine-containing phosphotransfer) domain-containing protein